jgi:four helix bundle protein
MWFGTESKRQLEVFMAVKVFEELEVWKESRRLTQRIYHLTKTENFAKDFGLRDQIRRATVSIMSNIAEGFERGTTQETLTFLYISRGSAGETRSMYCLLERLPEFIDFRSEISDLKSRAESISRQLRAWAESLQNTDIRGTRYLTNQSRRADERRREREEFLAELEQIRNRKH